MIERINSAGHGQDGLYLWFLGQAGFVLQSRWYRIVIDPYLTGLLEDEAPEGRAKLSSRAYPPPLTAAELTGVDLICVSHDHGDHLNIDTLRGMAQANPKAKVIGPAHTTGKLESAGFDKKRIVKAPTNTWTEVTAGVRVYPLPAAHYGLDQAAGDYAYLGFVLDIEGIRVYHSGDTLIYPELMEYLKPLLPIDVALLPINGRHAFREAQGFIGNMTYQEAADLAGTLVNW